MKTAVIGIDGGGSHTRGVLLSLDGEVLALESSGASNYLGVGLEPATRALEELIAKLTTAARDRGVQISAGGFGLSGLDRPKDAEVFTGILKTAGAGAWPIELVNDAYLALRAATPSGVGLCAVAGTGSNTVGVDAKGRRERVGGLAFEFGDFGGAHDIGIAAMRAAFRGEDGRGPVTTLSAGIRRALKVERLDALIDVTSPDALHPFAAGQLCPLVFEAASSGDAVALGILRQAGHDLGVAARLVAQRLFQPADDFVLVLGGKVLTLGSSDAMRDALVEQVRSHFANVKPSKLATDPVLGAALLAIDRLAPQGWPDVEAFAAAQRALQHQGAA